MLLELPSRLAPLDVYGGSGATDDVPPIATRLGGQKAAVVETVVARRPGNACDNSKRVCNLSAGELRSSGQGGVDRVWSSGGTGSNCELRDCEQM